MIKQTPWIERSFPVISDNGLLPCILERLSGTHSRIKDLILHCSESQITNKTYPAWSIKEEIGHLGDLEILWMTRVREFKQGVEVLSAADMSNQKTHSSNHNAADINILLESFCSQRSEMVDTLVKLSEMILEHIALHPRLKMPMRIIDLCYFVAEHDDHHLAHIRKKISDL